MEMELSQTVTCNFIFRRPDTSECMFCSPPCLKDCSLKFDPCLLCRTIDIIKILIEF